METDDDLRSAVERKLVSGRVHGGLDEIFFECESAIRQVESVTIFLTFPG